MLQRTRFIGLAVLLLSALVPLLVSSPSTAQAQNRHVFIEEFTGNWCGWCPRGIWGIEQLKAKYGDKVIAVAIHGGSSTEPMQTTVGNQLMNGMVGLQTQTDVQSFPNSWVNREEFTYTDQSTGQPYDGWDLDPFYWTNSSNTGAVDSMVDQPAVATASLTNVTYDPTSRLLSATVNAKFKSAMSGDFRFTLYVTEDSVFGPPGSNYDQHNYYSGTNYDPSNPWTDSASVVPGYHHMHVVRAILGGTWGTQSIIPSSVTAGSSYSQTFTFTIPTSMNPLNMHVIGTVHEYNTSSISGNVVFDAAEAPVTTLPAAPVGISLPNGSFVTIKNSGTTQYPVKITNNANVSATVSLKASNASGIEISGWSASLSQASVTVPANSSTTVMLNITAPANSGFISDTVTALPTAEGYIGVNTSVAINALSDNTQCVIYCPGWTLENAMYLGIIDTLRAHTAILPLIDSTLANYPPESFPVSVYDNINLLDNGGDPSLADPTVLPNIVAALQAGKKVFISSDLAMGYAFDASDGYFSQFSNYTETSDVQAFYAKIGLSWFETVRNWNSSNNLTPFSIKGVASDPIGDKISATDKGGFISEIFNIDSASSAVFYRDGAPANVIGARYEDPTTHGRLVYLGFGLSELTNQSVANAISGNSIKWLLSSQNDAVTPQAGVVQSAMTASPNPFHGMTQVQYTAAPGERNVTLAAYDLLGHKVAKLAATNSGNVYSANFDGSKLANGTYVIIAHSTAGTHKVQVVDQQ